MNVRRSTTPRRVALLIGLFVTASSSWEALRGAEGPPAQAQASPARPLIRKLGTIEADLVEATPIVFRDRLYRFEYVRPGYHANKTGDSWFHFVDVETGKPSAPFAHGYDLGCAYVEGDAVWAFGVTQWDGDTIAGFRSTDLEHWEKCSELKLPGWGLFNTSVCKAGNRYVMAIEVGRPPEVVGVPFTTRFAESNDLREWKLLPESHVFTKDRYSACPSIRFLDDGWFYMLYLEARPGPAYETHLVRSKDLTAWQPSPLNPIMKASDDDKLIANPNLSPAHREKIAAAVDLNNSDMDLCEFHGKTIISYSWGNQMGVEFLAAAEYDGPVASFLHACFP